MSIYLNNNKAIINYKKLVNAKYFVDKTMIIKKLNRLIDTSECCVCITKPRRFGKSSIINMLGAYYTKDYNTRDIFDTFSISKCDDYNDNINKYNVIHISLNEISLKENTYEKYIGRIINFLKMDILEKFPDLKLEDDYEIYDLLNQTNERFIFIIDEWDYIFSHNLFKENQKDFLEFLRELLKDKPYVALCYMTGVLPIKQYSEGSALNMFHEYTMLNDCVYDNYFGFTEDEVKYLCKKQSKVDFMEISEWYNGYLNEDNEKIYNPRSVVNALQDGKCRSYWTRTGKLDEVLFYLKYNIADVREDVIKMINNTPIRLKIRREYSAGQEAPKNREEIYSAMIVYGFLSYHNGIIRIPNKELMAEFEYAIEDKSFGYISELVRNSENILQATLSKDEKTVAEKLHCIPNYKS